MSEHKIVNGAAVPLSEDEIAAMAAELQAAQVMATAIAWAQLRADRDARLAACDWTELAYLSGRMDAVTWTSWDAYRQALRDLPAITANPAAPTWPEVTA